jgi:hypothetical protein
LGEREQTDVAVTVVSRVERPAQQADPAMPAIERRG